MLNKGLKHNRRSLRIPDFDYSQGGLYFVTICTQNQEEFFGNVKNTKMHLSSIGNIANQCWEQIPQHFPNTKLDHFTVMPNHIHGIIEIVDSVGVQNFEPLQFNPTRINRFQKIIPHSLGCIIRGFKIGVTKWCKQNNYKKFMWQRNFYEHIIQNDVSLENIRLYICNNQREWDTDIENRFFRHSLIKRKISIDTKNYYKNIFKRCAIE